MFKKFLAVFAALILLFSQPAQAYSQNGSVKISVLDIGQGDALLIETSEQNILIDCASAKEKNRLIKALDRAGINRIEKLILTHAHEDHIGNAKFLLENFVIDEVISNGVVTSSPVYKKIADRISNTVKAGDILNFGGGAVFYVLNPSDEAPTNINNSSIVGKFVFKNFSMLFTGDAEKQVEDALIHDDIQADILKAGHHGSNTSNSLDFIAAVSPKVIVISAGEDNKFGHPHKKALSNMRTFTQDIFCTRWNGSINIFSDGDDFNISVDNDLNWLETYTGERVVVTRL